MKKFMISLSFLSLLALVVLLSFALGFVAYDYGGLASENIQLKKDKSIMWNISEKTAEKLRAYELKEEWREAHEEYKRVYAVVSETGLLSVTEHNDWALSVFKKCRAGNNDTDWTCERESTLARTQELLRCHYYRFGILEGPPLCPSLSDEGDTQAASA